MIFYGTIYFAHNMNTTEVRILNLYVKFLSSTLRSLYTIYFKNLRCQKLKDKRDSKFFLLKRHIVVSFVIFYD